MNVEEKSKENLKTDHSLFQDMQTLLRNGDVKESERMFRLAHAHEADAQEEKREENTNRVFWILGLVLLCIAILATGYALTHSSKEESPVVKTTATPIPFVANEVKTISIAGLMPFEKIELWKKTILALPANTTTAITINPIPTLPDVFNTKENIPAMHGIQNVFIGVRSNTPPAPFIVASIADIDAVHVALQENPSTLSDGLALLFGYTSLPFSARSNISTETTTFQNQTMTKVFAHYKEVPVVLPETETVQTAENVVQTLVDSINIPKNITTETPQATPEPSSATTTIPLVEIPEKTLLFVYTIVRHKYLVIAPTEVITHAIASEITE